VKFVGTREFRNRPGHMRALAQKDDLVLTAKGEPICILTSSLDAPFISFGQSRSLGGSNSLAADWERA